MPLVGGGQGYLLQERDQVGDLEGVEDLGIQGISDDFSPLLRHVQGLDNRCHQVPDLEVRGFHKFLLQVVREELFEVLVIPVQL